MKKLVFLSIIATLVLGACGTKSVEVTAPTTDSTAVAVDTTTAPVVADTVAVK